MSTKKTEETIGHCSCKSVAYALHEQPLFIHCCHCHYCQRETGSAFVLNALIETSHVEILSGEVKSTKIPTNSGAGQTIVRCKKCHSALWSHYGAAKESVAFVRAGSLENSEYIKPDIHIFVESKQHWVKLEDDTPRVDQFYQRSKYWPEDCIKRYKLAIANL